MPADLEGCSVLLADDDPDVLTSLRVAFNATKATVSTANDGNRAVETARRVNPDLIILDMMMPKKSGFLVIESLKPNGQAGTKPYIIMITANEGKRHEAYARHLGVDDYVSKPFSTERLVESAANLLNRPYKDPESL